MSLTAISSASQQTLSLHRLHCYKDGLARLRNMLGEQSSKDSNKWIVRPVQLFVWQIPVMLLNFSVLLYLSGLVKLLEARATAQSWSVSSSDTKVCGSRCLPDSTFLTDYPGLRGRRCDRGHQFRQLHLRCKLLVLSDICAFLLLGIAHLEKTTI